MAIFINFAVYENDSISIHLDSDNKGISSGLKYFSIHSDFGYMENTVKCNRYILDNTIMIDNENEASYKDQLKDALTKLFNDIYFKNMWMVERCAKWFIDAYSDACMNKFNVYESDIGRLDIHMVKILEEKERILIFITMVHK